MKKIININLSARLIPIEDSAYEILRQYLDSLRRHFSKEEGAEEILSDIESRVAELFQDKLKNGAHCITDEDVQAVIASIGRPEQFEGDNTTGQEAPETNTFQPRGRKRLYRDPDSKVLGGVCGGLGNYFNVDPVVFRIVFALLAIAGFGTGVLAYFILWVATPEATTAAEKLEMRGERVDLNSIKSTIQDEINQIKGNMGKVGDDIRNFTSGRGKQAGNGIERFFHGLADLLGRTIVILGKGVFYFLMVVLLICFITAAVTITSFSAFFPIKGVLLNPGLQSNLLWVTIALVFGIPVVAIIIFIVRKLTGIRQSSRGVSAALGVLWVIGLVCGLWLAASLGRDFRAGEHVTEKRTLVMPSHGKLVVKQQGWDNDESGHLQFGDLIADEDTVLYENAVNVRTETSPTGNFELEIRRRSRGRNMSQARYMAEQIQLDIHQEDSILYIPNDITIPRGVRFRGQEADVIVYVPAGKEIDMSGIRDGYRHHHVHFGRHGRNINIDVDDDDNDNDSDSDAAPVQNVDSLREHFRYHGSSDHQQDDSSQHTPVDNSDDRKTSATGMQATSLVLYSLYNLLKIS